MEVAVVVMAFALGAFVQTVAGFGSALVAMPILTFVIAVQTAAPVQAILGLSVSATVLYRNRHGFLWREAARLVAGSVIGVPIGALALKSLPSSPVTACLGLIMLTYGLFLTFVAPRLKHAETETGPDENEGAGAPRVRFSVGSWIAGFFSGILGGAYATDGPPLIIFGAIKGWPKATFKSILQCCFLINGTCMVFWHGMNGLITHQVFVYCLCGFPGLLAGMLVGTYVDAYIDHERFRRLLLILILVLGAVLLIRSLFG